MWKKLMPRNQHPIERVIRIVLGLSLLSLVFIGPQSLWGLLGVIPLVTGFVGSCPLYTLFGIKTCRGECKPLGSARMNA
jgi:hypothetical protein